MKYETKYDPRPLVLSVVAEQMYSYPDTIYSILGMTVINLLILLKKRSHEEMSHTQHDVKQKGQGKKRRPLPPPRFPF